MAKRRRRGTTLIEVMVVIAIIGLMTGMVAVYAMARYEDSRLATAKTELRTIESALDMYRLAKGRLPDPSAGLKPLLEGRYLKMPTVDPWGQPFAYTLQNGEPVITSAGPDRVSGTPDDLSSATLD